MSDAQTRLREALRQVASGTTFSAKDMADIIALLMEVDLREESLGQLASAFICSLKTRGETGEEIFGAASCLKSHQIGVEVPSPSGVLIDTCGTGGDGAHLLNISTITGLVIASLGVPVAKHGNRSVSSSCGSADLLEGMGYPLHGDPTRVAEEVKKTGFGFLFAPHFHPALKNLSGLRRTLGVRTMFNMLGPLVNPAGVTHQLIGVFDKNIVKPMAQAASQLGLKRCVVVHGEGGLDELSPQGATWACLAENGEVRDLLWTPESFGADPVSLNELKGGDVSQNATLTRKLFRGESPSVASAVAMNCAACLWLVERVSTLEDGYKLSFEAIQSGRVETFFEECRISASRAEVTPTD